MTTSGWWDFTSKHFLQSQLPSFINLSWCLTKRYALSELSLCQAVLELGRYSLAQSTGTFDFCPREHSATSCCTQIGTRLWLKTLNQNTKNILVEMDSECRKKKKRKQKYVTLNHQTFKMMCTIVIQDMLSMIKATWHAAAIMILVSRQFQWAFWHVLAFWQHIL